MICPLYQLAITNPNDPYLILHDRHVSFLDLHHQVLACEDVLVEYPIRSPIAIESTDTYILLSWLYAAARTGHCIAIPSTKDPLPHRNRQLQHLSIYTTSLQWSLPAPIVHEKKDPKPSTVDNPDWPWCILFTSGSSGTPKAVVHSFLSLWKSAHFSHQNIAFSKGHRWLQSLFLWHIGGLMIPIRALYGGASIIEKDPTIPLGSQVDRDYITHISVVATQLYDLLQGDHHLGSLTAILVGGGIIPSRLIERSHQSGLPIHTTYGMTELGSQLTTTPTASSLSTLQSAGLPIGDWQIRIGADQEIQVRGSPLFLGYWNGTTIKDPKDPSGWFGTKDRGTIVDGKLYPVGRVDQMFISGGENIHPEEIESVLHDQGIFSIVVAVPHERYGQRPVAFVLADLSDELKEQIQRAFITHLPKFKRPDAIFQWPPGVDTYKPSRRALEKIARILINAQ